jgi:hypothetical protein
MLMIAWQGWDDKTSSNENSVLYLGRLVLKQESASSGLEM